ncbi:MAG TPA: hypothetical protein VMU67_06350 [Steroidobacteraceae bacterium]|nr:hypothetical protein [Steroidobacteraceae bacterium]
MKFSSNYAVLAVALAAIGTGGIVASASAQQSDSASSSTSAASTANNPGHHWHRWHRRPMMVGLLLRAAHNAGITVNRGTLRSCFAQLRGQGHAGSPPATTPFTVLGDLAAGNTTAYSTDVGSLASEASSRAQSQIERQSELTQCVYTAMALNPTQASALASELQQMQTKLQQRRAARASHSSG